MSTYKFDKVLYVFSAVKINEGYHDEFFGTSCIALDSYEAVCSNRSTYSRGGPISKIALIYRYNIDTLDISFICIS